MTTFLCILQKSSFKVPKDERMGVVDLFPFFFGLLIPSTLNHWHFPQVTFTGASVQLHLHKQGTFLALLLGRAQVGVGEHMRVWTSHAGL